jgi:hypothetical protein
MTCDPNDGAPRTTAQWFNTELLPAATLAANAGQIGDEPRDASAALASRARTCRCSRTSR